MALATASSLDTSPPNLTTSLSSPCRESVALECSKVSLPEVCTGSRREIEDNQKDTEVIGIGVSSVKGRSLSKVTPTSADRVTLVPLIRDGTRVAKQCAFAVVRLSVADPSVRLLWGSTTDIK